MIELETGYLYRHFRILTQTVERLYDDLLLPSELNFLSLYASLSQDAQHVLLRLMSRRSNWYERSKILYPEVANSMGAINELLEWGLLICPLKITFTDTLQMVSRPDAESLLTQQGIALAGSKSLAKASFVTWADNVVSETQKANIAGQVQERWVKPNEFAKDFFGLLQYLYFGNSVQNLTDFVLTEMQIARYESYALHKSTRSFTSRSEIDHCLAANQLFDSCFFSLENPKCTYTQKVLSEIQFQARSMIETSCARAHKKLYKLLYLTGRTWERRKNWQKALECYQGNVSALERTLRCLVSAGDKPAALALAESLAKLPHVPFSAMECAQKILAKEAQKIPVKEIKFGFSQSTKSRNIEETALKRWEALGWQGWHCENALWTSLFGIVFWEAIFADTQGAFFHPFQAGPVDAFSTQFYGRRQAICDAILTEFVTNNQKNEFFLDRWNTKKGITNLWVPWSDRLFDALQALLALASRQDLAKVLVQMLQNPKQACAGFPDLFVTKENQFAFWEVKGPGDRLRPHQKSWLSFFTQLEWESGICYLYLE